MLDSMYYCLDNNLSLHVIVEKFHCCMHQKSDDCLQNRVGHWWPDLIKKIRIRVGIRFKNDKHLTCIMFHILKKEVNQKVSLVMNRITVCKSNLKATTALDLDFYSQTTIYHAYNYRFYFMTISWKGSMIAIYFC